VGSIIGSGVYILTEVYRVFHQLLQEKAKFFKTDRKKSFGHPTLVIIQNHPIVESCTTYLAEKVSSHKIGTSDFTFKIVKMLNFFYK
jgi:hypothetical protein